MKKILFLAIGIFLFGNLFSQTSKKENFKAVNGEQILQKISKLKLSSWNYEGKKNVRYYTPSAKDFFDAFGNDGIGKIGCDSVIDVKNLSSINLIAIKALVQRTKELKSTQDELQKTQQRLQETSSKVMDLQMQIDKMQSSLDDIDNFRAKLTTMEEKMQDMKSDIEELKK